MDLFSGSQLGTISQSSFELGRLYAQEDILDQYKRCQTIGGLSEIDFGRQKQEWLDELNSGIYKFTFRSVGCCYYLGVEKHQIVQEWQENAIPDCMFYPDTTGPLLVCQPATPISPPSQSTVKELQLSQSVSEVSLSNLDYDSDTSSCGYFPAEMSPAMPVNKRSPVRIKEESCKKVKFETIEKQPPGAYPGANLSKSGPSSPTSAGASCSGLQKAPLGGYVQRKPGYPGSKPASFTWAADQSNMPMLYDRRVAKGSVEDDPDEAKFLSKRSRRASKVDNFFNREMLEEEYDYWDNWSGAKEHPFRSIPGEPNKSRTPLSLWPFYVDRTPQLSLYHMCRHKDGVLLTDLIPIRLYSVEQGHNIEIWLPKCCGEGTTFQSILRRTGHISIKQIAEACGFRQTSELSKGLMVFIFNLCFGNIKYHELYYGRCGYCDTYFCHLDKKVDHPCQCKEHKFPFKGSNASNNLYPA